MGLVVLGVAHRMSSGPVPGMAGDQIPHNRGATAQSSGLAYGTLSHPDGLTPLGEGAIFVQCLTAFNELSHTNSSGILSFVCVEFQIWLFTNVLIVKCAERNYFHF